MNMSRWAQVAPLAAADVAVAVETTAAEAAATARPASAAGGGAGSGAAAAAGAADDTGLTRQDYDRGENFISKYLSAPADAVSQFRDLGEAERERDIATSAAGMSDATRENLIQFFSERGLAITPEVDEAVKDVALSMPIDWSDKENVDAIYGSVSKALENGGPAEATKVMGWMAEFHDIAMRNPTFNRTEMLNIVGHWLKGDTDPKELAVRTRSFLDTATRDWSDPMSALGIDNPQQAADGRRARMIFMNILSTLSERPDQQQKVVSQGARAYQAYRQNLFNNWKAITRRISPEVYNVMGWGGGLAGKGANFFGDYTNPWANVISDTVINPAAGALSVPQFAYVPVGQYGQTLTGQQPLKPQQMAAPGRRAAISGSRFVKVAQSMVNPSIAGGQIVPRQDTPSNNPAGEKEAFQMDMMKSLVETSGASDAAELAYNQILGTEKFKRMQQLKYDTARLEQNLTAYEQDIRTGRGVADLRLIEQVDQMHERLAKQSDEMMSLYDEAMAQLVKRRDTAKQQLMQRGVDDPVLQNSIQTYDFAISDMATKKNEQRIQREQFLLRSKKLSNELRFQAREVMEVNPLRKQRDILREGVGADAGASLALSAAEMKQAREKMQEVNRLKQLDPNVSGVQQGRALGEAYDQYLNAIRDIDRSAKPAIPQDKLMETQGVS